jgi:hypothetical protein
MTKSKEELLIENAILKQSEVITENFRKTLKEELSPLNVHIKTLEDRVDTLDDRVKTVEEIIEPFGIIRRRFWFFLIAGTLIVSVAGNKLSDYISKMAN